MVEGSKDRGAAAHARSFEAGAASPTGADDVLCFEQGRLRRAMPLLVSRCMGYSALPCFDDDLVAAVLDFYGLEMDVATAEAEILEDEDERVRFFPWFLWDWRRRPDAPTVGERYAEEERCPSHDKRILEGLCHSYVGFFEALKPAELSGCTVRDLATGEVMRIADGGLAGELRKGQILQARLARVPLLRGGAAVLVDAVYAVLPAHTRGQVAHELEGLLGHGGSLDQRHRSLKDQTPEVLEIAERLLELALQPMVPRTAEGDRLVLCRSVLRGHAAARVLASLSAPAPSAPASQDASAPVDGLPPARDELVRADDDGTLWRLEPLGSTCVVGFLKAGGAPERPTVTLGASSVPRMEELENFVASRFGVARPSMRTMSDFVGEVERWVTTGGGRPWVCVDADVVRGVESWLERFSRSGLDLPAAWLDHRTPREGMHSPEHRARVDRVLRRLEGMCATGGALSDRSRADLGTVRRELELPSE